MIGVINALLQVEKCEKANIGKLSMKNKNNLSTVPNF